MSAVCVRVSRTRRHLHRAIPQTAVDSTVQAYPFR